MTVVPGWPQDGKDPSSPDHGGSADQAGKEVLPPTLFQLPSLRTDPVQEPKRVGPPASSAPASSAPATSPLAGESSVDESDSPRTFATESMANKTMVVDATSSQAVTTDPRHLDQRDQETPSRETPFRNPIADREIPHDAHRSLYSDVNSFATEPLTTQNVEPIQEAKPSYSTTAPVEVPAPPSNVTHETKDDSFGSTRDPQDSYEIEDEVASSLRTSPADDPIRNPIPPARPSIGVPAGRSWSESIGSHGIVLALLLVVVAAALISGRDGEKESAESSLAEHSDLIEFDSGELVSLPDPATNPQIPSSTVSVEPQFSNTGEAPSLPSPEDELRNTRFKYDEMVEAPGSSDVGFDLPATTTPNDIDVIAAKPSETVESPTPNGVRRNEFFTSDSVPAMTASSRSDSNPSPSLEDLTVPQLQAPQPRQSSTPAKLQDLLKYLPPQ